MQKIEFLLLVAAAMSLASVGLPATAGDESDSLESLSITADGTRTMNGLVTPLGQAGRNFYLQNRDGSIEVLLDPDAQIGLLVSGTGIQQMLENRKIVLPMVGQEYPLPDELYVKVRFANWQRAQRAIASGELRAGIVYTTPLPDHLPSERELWFSGRISALITSGITPLKEVAIGARTFLVATSGHGRGEQIVGLFGADRIVPFVNQARVYGRMQAGVFHASDVLLRPIPDQTRNDDPTLPRYLFIGDSISGGYYPGLRATLKGKLVPRHPPTNCGSSGKGRARVNVWLGDYQIRGRHWDVISFNFGHWDAGSTREQYQQNLEAVIEQLEKTGAKLVWVTTCPVPDGYAAAGGLEPDGSAPGRTAGVMKKYLNPWAAEVIARHPEIAVCDQWQYVYDRRDGLYEDWWSGETIHFTGEPAAALGEFLAECVLHAVNSE